MSREFKPTPSWIPSRFRETSKKYENPRDRLRALLEQGGHLEGLKAYCATLNSNELLRFLDEQAQTLKDDELGTLLKCLCEAHPRSFRLQVALARYYDDHDSPFLAQGHFILAMQADDIEGASLDDLGLVYMSCGEYAQAMDTFEIALRQISDQKKKADCCLKIAHCLLSLGFGEDAAAYFATAHNLDSDNPLHEDFIFKLFSSGYIESALKLFPYMGNKNELLCRMFTSIQHEIDTYFKTAKLCVAFGDLLFYISPQNGITMYQKAVDLEPSSFYLQNLYQHLKKSGRMEEALGTLDQLVGINPSWVSEREKFISAFVQEQTRSGFIPPKVGKA